LLIFKDLRKIMGGNIRWMISGGAPMSATVIDFLKITFGCPILEGYGLTELCGASHIPLKADGKSAGYVGGVVRTVEFKLVDIPEMNYTSMNRDKNGNLIPQGEICMRGPQLFQGYYRSIEKTKEVMDNDGWFHTGDVGQINPNSALQIIDRKKNIFKLAIGEYVAPEKIENIYRRSRLVADIFVHGETLQNYLVAVIVPDNGKFTELVESIGAKGTLEELCVDERVITKFVEEITITVKKEKLWTFEQVKKIILEPKSFVSLGLCTPNLKIKRNDARAYYKTTLNLLYDEI